MERSVSKSVVLVLFVFIFPVTLFSQHEFLPGYIITVSGDTIHGEIKDRTPVRNSKSCVFRENENEKPVEYLPFDILSYRFDKGKYYISKMVPVGDKKVPMFLEFLVKGEANLYVYRDGEKDHFLIERKGYPLVELTNEKKVVEKEDGFYASYSREYIGALRYLFSDYQSLYPEINSLKLGEKDLIKFAKDFHAKACEGEKCIVYEKTFFLQKMKVRAGPVAGMNVAFLDYRLKSKDKTDDVHTYDPSFSFVPGLEVMFWFNRKEKIGIGFYGTYMTNVYHGNYFQDGVYSESFTDVSNVRLGLWFKGVIVEKKVRPYYFLGGGVNLTFSQRSEYVYDRIGSSTVVSYYGEKEGGPVAKNNMGPVGGVGVDLPLQHFIPFIETYCEAFLFTFENDVYASSNISAGVRVGIFF